jgi:hypothetical protein
MFVLLTVSTILDLAFLKKVYKHPKMHKFVHAHTHTHTDEVSVGTVLTLYLILKKLTSLPY